MLSFIIRKVAKILIGTYYSLHIVYFLLLLVVFHFTIDDIIVVKIEDASIRIDLSFIIKMIIIIVTYLAGSR